MFHAVGVQSGHRAPAGRTETDSCAKRPPIFTGDPQQLHGVQHRAVAGQFVVLMENVQAKRAVAVPVVHRLKRDQGQLAVWTPSWVMSSYWAQWA